VGNDGIFLDGGAAGTMRIGASGIAFQRGTTSLTMNGTTVFLQGPQGAQVVLTNGGVLLDTPSAGSLDIGVSNPATILRGPGYASFVQLRPQDVMVGGGGSGATFGAGPLGSQVDVSGQVIQMSSGMIGLGGFCYPLVRARLDPVVNRREPYAPLGPGEFGWQNGGIPTGSAIASAC
jgi:hypothetical protein